MSYLIAVSILSFLAIIFMLAKKVRDIASRLDTESHGAHTNFIAEFVRSLKKQLVMRVRDAHRSLIPHVHDVASFVAAKMYRLSSWFAREFLKFYNFIQGRKVLKNSGRTSVFVRNISNKPL